jgi:putative transposase
MTEERTSTLALIAEAVKSGCRLAPACREAGLDPRTVQRWRVVDGGEDRRRGPHSSPRQKLSDAERAAVIQTATSPEFRNASPKQIVPRLADQGVYLASEATFYRVLHAHNLMAHRSPTKPRRVNRPDELAATGPNVLWSWDITYLPSQVRGKFFYLYLFIDVWSRRIMKAVVHAEESTEHAGLALAEACAEHRVQPDVMTLHADNGSPMKGSTMLATMQSLGVVPSFSRPSVSNDNPYSESLFRTLKHTPAYPRKPFATVDEAWAWVERFVDWYNHEHRHSAIGFVTPDERHNELDIQVLASRRALYDRARLLHPERWSRHTRRWNAPAAVTLNPRDPQTRARASEQLRLGATPTTSMAPPPPRPAAATLPRRHTA